MFILLPYYVTTMFQLRVLYSAYLDDYHIYIYIYIYRVIEKNGRDLKLGLSISIYLNSMCFHRLKHSNKKL